MKATLLLALCAMLTGCGGSGAISPTPDAGTDAPPDYCAAPSPADPSCMTESSPDTALGRDAGQVYCATADRTEWWIDPSTGLAERYLVTEGTRHAPSCVACRVATVSGVVLEREVCP